MRTVCSRASLLCLGSTAAGPFSQLSISHTDCCPLSGHGYQLPEGYRSVQFAIESCRFNSAPSTSRMLQPEGYQNRSCLFSNSVLGQPYRFASRSGVMSSRRILARAENVSDVRHDTSSSNSGMNSLHRRVISPVSETSPQSTGVEATLLGERDQSRRQQRVLAWGQRQCLRCEKGHYSEIATTVQWALIVQAIVGFLQIVTGVYIAMVDIQLGLWQLTSQTWWLPGSLVAAASIIFIIILQRRQDRAGKVTQAEALLLLFLLAIVLMLEAVYLGGSYKLAEFSESKHMSSNSSPTPPQPGTDTGQDSHSPGASIVLSTTVGACVCLALLNCIASIKWLCPHDKRHRCRPMNFRLQTKNLISWRKGQMDGSVTLTRLTALASSTTEQCLPIVTHGAENSDHDEEHPQQGHDYNYAAAFSPSNNLYASIPLAEIPPTEGDRPLHHEYSDLPDNERVYTIAMEDEGSVGEHYLVPVDENVCCSCENVKEEQLTASGTISENAQQGCLQNTTHDSKPGINELEKQASNTESCPTMDSVGRGYFPIRQQSVVPDDYQELDGHVTSSPHTSIHQEDSCDNHLLAASVRDNTGCNQHTERSSPLQNTTAEQQYYLTVFESTSAADLVTKADQCTAFVSASTQTDVMKSEMNLEPLYVVQEGHPQGHSEDVSPTSNTQELKRDDIFAAKGLPECRHEAQASAVTRSVNCSPHSHSGCFPKHHDSFKVSCSCSEAPLQSDGIVIDSSSAELSADPAQTAAGYSSIQHENVSCEQYEPLPVDTPSSHSVKHELYQPLTEYRQAESVYATHEGSPMPS